MGNSRSKEQIKKKPPLNHDDTGIRRWWKQKRPVIYFVGGFALGMILFYTLWLSPFFFDHVQPYILKGYAAISNGCLRMLGQGTSRHREIISSPAFSMSVSRGCDAVEAMAIFASATLAFPAPLRKKLQGLLLGISVLFLLNILRIVSLFLTGVYAHSLFDFMHVEAWQALFIFFALGLWILWVKRNGKSTATHAV